MKAHTPVIPRKHSHRQVTEQRKGAAVSRVVQVAAKRRASIQSANQRRKEARHDSRG